MKKTGPIGRSARIVLGIIFLWVFFQFLRGLWQGSRPGTVTLVVWAGVGVFSHAVGTFIPVFRHSRLRVVFFLVFILLAGILGQLLWQQWWSWPIVYLLYALALVATGVLGLEFILAGLLGYPGCESTAFYNLLHPHAPTRTDSCPLWDPLDRWEARRKEHNRSRETSRE